MLLIEHCLFVKIVDWRSVAAAALVRGRLAIPWGCFGSSSTLVERVRSLLFKLLEETWSTRSYYEWALTFSRLRVILAIPRLVGVCLFLRRNPSSALLRCILRVALNVARFMEYLILSGRRVLGFSIFVRSVRNYRSLRIG